MSEIVAHEDTEAGAGIGSPAEIPNAIVVWASAIAKETIKQLKEADDA